MNKIYVQYGCGLSAPKEWINFDVSPTLRIQKIPILGSILKNSLNVSFPDNVLYGDIVKGLPIDNKTCDGLYCSHTLEHLALADFKIAIQHSYNYLKQDGIFRCVVPDLEYQVRQYINRLDGGDVDANSYLMNATLMGVQERKRGLKAFISSFYGNANHLWMWDYASLIHELKQVGFSCVKACKFNDSKDDMFKLVEDTERFENSVAIECVK